MAMPRGPMDLATKQAMLTVMQGGQTPFAGRQPNYMPSMTLRAAIMERLEAQHKALEEASEEIQRLMKIAEAGEEDLSQLPGDQQISGEDFSAIRQLAKVEGVVDN